MDTLIIGCLMQQPPSPQAARADAEDRYYRTHDRAVASRILPIASMAAVVGLFMFTIDLLAR